MVFAAAVAVEKSALQVADIGAVVAATPSTTTATATATQRRVVAAM